MERITLRESILGFHFATSIGILYLIRRIKDPQTKKWVSSAHGLLVLTTICGWGVIHLLVTFLGCSFIILYGSKRYCHAGCLVFTFFYLGIYHLEEFLHLPVSPVYTTNAINILVLKIVHLAGEVQDIYTNKKERRETRRNDEKKKGEITEATSKIERDSIRVRDEVYKKLTLSEICHFNLSSISTINFFSYRTYYDWINQPSAHARCNEETMWEVFRSGILAICFVPVSIIFPGDYIRTDKFYEEPALYQLVYTTFVAIGCRIGMYLVLSWTNAIAIAGGMGSYPSVTKPRPGKGPTEQFALLKEISQNPDRGKNIDYNFNAVCNLDVVKAEFSPLLRDFWRFYNCSITHFFVANIYTRCPIDQLKIFAVFFASAWWHGFHAGFYLGIVYTAAYVPAEDLWDNLFRKNSTGNSRKVWDVAFFISRSLALTYISTATYLQWYKDAYRYTTSTYFLPYIIPIMLYGIGKIIEKSTKQNTVDNISKIPAN